MQEKIRDYINKYLFETDYINESFDDEYEDVIIPIREYLHNYPEALEEIVKADEKLIKGYEKLPSDSYLKMILTPIYKMAKENVEAHLKVA